MYNCNRTLHGNKEIALRPWCKTKGSMQRLLEDISLCIPAFSPAVVQQIKCGLSLKETVQKNF